MGYFPSFPVFPRSGRVRTEGLAVEYELNQGAAEYEPGACATLGWLCNGMVSGGVGCVTIPRCVIGPPRHGVRHWATPWTASLGQSVVAVCNSL